MADQNDRFKATNDGRVQITVKMPTSEFLELPNEMATFTKEAITHKFSDTAKDALSFIIGTVSNFFPNEFESQRLHKELAEKKRR